MVTRSTEVVADLTPDTSGSGVGVTERPARKFSIHGPVLGLTSPGEPVTARRMGQAS